MHVPEQTLFRLVGWSSVIDCKWIGWNYKSRFQSDCEKFRLSAKMPREPRLRPTGRRVGACAALSTSVASNTHNRAPSSCDRYLEEFVKVCFLPASFCCKERSNCLVFGHHLHFGIVWPRPRRKYYTVKHFDVFDICGY